MKFEIQRFGCVYGCVVQAVGIMRTMQRGSVRLTLWSDMRAYQRRARELRVRPAILYKAWSACKSKYLFSMYRLASDKHEVFALVVDCERVYIDKCAFLTIPSDQSDKE